MSHELSVEETKRLARRLGTSARALSETLLLEAALAEARVAEALLAEALAATLERAGFSRASLAPLGPTAREAAVAVVGLAGAGDV